VVEKAMKFPHIFLVVLILLATPIGALAFASQQCPIISVEAPAEEIEEGTPLVFTAKLNAVVPTAKPQFKWTLSAGTITAGDGTAVITVDTAGLGGQDVTATVEGSGISTTCSMVATISVNVLTGPVCNLPFDQYGDLRFRDEKARLDNFAIELTNYEGSTGYIIAYAGNPSYEGEAAERLLRAKNYLVKIREMNPARIITIDGGYMEDFYVTLVIAPPGAAPPSAMPSLSRESIGFTKSHPSLSKRKPRKRT